MNGLFGRQAVVATGNSQCRVGSINSEQTTPSARNPAVIMNGNAP